MAEGRRERLNDGKRILMKRLCRVLDFELSRNLICGALGRYEGVDFIGRFALPSSSMALFHCDTCRNRIHNPCVVSPHAEQLSHVTNMTG